MYYRQAKNEKMTVFKNETLPLIKLPVTVITQRFYCTQINLVTHLKTTKICNRIEHRTFKPI